MGVGSPSCPQPQGERGSPCPCSTSPDTALGCTPTAPAWRQQCACVFPPRFPASVASEPRSHWPPRSGSRACVTTHAGRSPICILPVLRTLIGRFLLPLTAGGSRGRCLRLRLRAGGHAEGAETAQASRRLPTTVRHPPRPAPGEMLRACQRVGVAVAAQVRQGRAGPGLSLGGGRPSAPRRPME